MQPTKALKIKAQIGRKIAAGSFLRTFANLSLHERPAFSPALTRRHRSADRYTATRMTSVRPGQCRDRNKECDDGRYDWLPRPRPRPVRRLQAAHLALGRVLGTSRRGRAR